MDNKKMTDRMKSINEIVNTSKNEVLEEGKPMRVVGSMYSDDGVVKTNPNEFVTAIGAGPVHTYDFKTKETTLVGYIPMSGGGSAVSIIDLFEGNFGKEENTITYGTAKEAMKAGEAIAKAWNKFLKGYGVKR